MSKMLWKPSEERVKQSNMYRFMGYVNERYGKGFGDYESMYAWSVEEIADFLQTGIYSDGTESHAGMKSQVDRGLGKLTREDLLAIAAFLKNLPAIENLP